MAVRGEVAIALDSTSIFRLQVHIFKNAVSILSRKCAFMMHYRLYMIRVGYRFFMVIENLSIVHLPVCDYQLHFPDSKVCSRHLNYRLMLQINKIQKKIFATDISMIKMKQFL